MARTSIKICGICRPEDATAAKKAGADAVGIVFDPRAGRYVSPEEAARITAVVPAPFVSFGLFVNSTVSEIKRVQAIAGFSGAQLHGEESPEFVAELSPLPVIKTIHLTIGDAAIMETWRIAIHDLRLTNVKGLLVETARPAGPRGGTGIAGDFAGLRKMQDAGHFADLPPIMLAGGLTPENVGDVVRLLRPYGVDVSSGAESVHREKSAEKIAAFIRAVRFADDRSI